MLDFSKNHFELFGIPVAFDVDLGELARRFRDLQRVAHPDRFVKATERERRLSMQGTTRINEAYRVLKDPLERAAYLLSLHGVDLEAAGGRGTDAVFLMQQMELREQLAEVKQQSDPFAEVNDLMSRINQQIKRLTDGLTENFAAATPEQLDQACATVHKMQFLQKLRTEAEAVEAELDETL